MRTFIPLPPSSPFAVHEDGVIFIRYWTGPHYPALEGEVQKWINHLIDCEDEDHKAILSSIIKAKEEQAAWRENDRTE